MDLRSILNVDDRPKLATKSKQISRTDVRGHQDRSNADRRPLLSPVKIESSSYHQLTPMTSPAYSVCSTPTPWMQSPNTPQSSSGYFSNSGKTNISNRAKITLPTLATPSSTSKRRASGNSPGSHSSSSCSSPSPRTPSSVSSMGLVYNPSSSSRSRQHKRAPSSSKMRQKTPDTPSNFHQIGTQDPYPIRILPGKIQTSHTMHMPQVHLGRVLPPPTPDMAVHHHSHCQSVSQQYPMSHTSTDAESQCEITRVSSQRLCSAVSNCEYSTPKRRIVSQFFGRNKRGTLLIPQYCWVFYCRQHYQRCRYRLSVVRFAELQMSLVRSTLLSLEKENVVMYWEIKLRKRALEKVAKAEMERKLGKKSSDGHRTTHSNANTQGSRDSLLLPFCGARKTFKQVYEVLDVVNEICRNDGGPALDFELLPSFTEAHRIREEERRKARRATGDGSDSDSSDDD